MDSTILNCNDMARHFKAALRCGVVAVAALCAVNGQTLLNLGSLSRNVDFSSAPSTRPVKTGTVLPATCSTGDLFFKTDAPAGQNLFGCTASSGWALQGPAAPAPSGQTLENNGVALPQEPAVNFSSAFSLADNPASSRTELDLAIVNPNVGTFGSSAAIPVLTVNGYGQITGVSTAPLTGPSIQSGPFASIPGFCTTGSFYLATDQPLGQQIYTCSANVWTQTVNLGGSGALAFTNGSLDINTAIVPELGAANTFTGFNTVTNGLSLLTPNAQPLCSSDFRGTFWYLNNGASKDNVQVCVWDGTAYAWVNLY